MRLLAPLPLFLASILLGQSTAQSSFDSIAKRQVLQSLSKTLEERAFVPGADFKKVEELFDKEQPKIDQARNEDEFKDVVNGVLRQLGYSHVVMYSPKMLEQRRSQVTVGIGVVVSLEKDELLVHRVFSNTPAEESELKAGDRILLVDGFAPRSVSALSGNEGDELKLKVRTYEGNTREITLKRRAFNTSRPETLTWVDPKTAVLTVPTFDLSYNRKRVEDLMGQANTASSLILDLRGNPGGVVMNMTHLLGSMIPNSQPIGTMLSRRIVREYTDATKASPNDLAAVAKWTKEKIRPTKTTVPLFGGQITVLLNRTSGSASEMAAAALRETRGATIVGEKSAGQVLISVLGKLSQGFELQYPVTDYITVKGQRLEGVGVRPDVEAADPLVSRPDIYDDPLQKAIALSHRYQLKAERLGKSDLLERKEPIR